MDKNLAKFLSLLTSLKTNLPVHQVRRKYVDDFNAILIELEKSVGDDLSDFKILESEIGPKIVSFNFVTGENEYSRESYCEREYLLTKIDGVLGYFTLCLQPVETKNQLGFTVENNSEK